MYVTKASNISMIVSMEDTNGEPTKIIRVNNKKNSVNYHYEVHDY